MYSRMLSIVGRACGASVSKPHLSYSVNVVAVYSACDKK